MSEVRLPEYHHGIHLDFYGTHRVTGIDGDIETFVDDLVDIMYLGDQDDSGLEATDVATFYQATKLYEFVPEDAIEAPRTTELTRIRLTHTMLGTAASRGAREAFDIIATTIFSTPQEGRTDVLTRQFCIERDESALKNYKALMVRSDPMGREISGQEDMTDYDAEELFGILRALETALEEGRTSTPAS